MTWQCGVRYLNTCKFISLLYTRKQDDEQTARTFSKKLMMEGKVKSALRYISDISKGSVLSLDKTVPVKGSDGQDKLYPVRDVLRSKHPCGKPVQENSLLHDPIDSIDPVIFDAIDGTSIHAAALRISGAAGPSGLDANGWKRALDLANEKGASTCLTVLPIDEYGFALHKGAFRDALSLRYSWHILHQPESCACGKAFDVNHAMICPKGGFPILRHNEVRDITADLLSEICHDVEVEPKLQPLTGERLSHRTANVEKEARLDVKAHGFWDRMQCAFFDFRVFYPNAQSNHTSQPSTAYTRHESEKKRVYGQR